MTEANLEELREARQARFDACAHSRAARVPRRHLRECLGCGHRLIECSRCDAVTYAHPEIVSSGWGARGGTTAAGVSWRETLCPTCW